MAYLNRNILFFLITGLFIALAYSSPYKDLNIDFLLEDSTKAPIKKQVKTKKKAEKKSKEKCFSAENIYENKFHIVEVFPKNIIHVQESDDHIFLI